MWCICHIFTFIAAGVLIDVTVKFLATHEIDLFTLTSTCTSFDFKSVHTDLPLGGFELKYLGPQASVLPIEPILVVE